MDTLTDAEKKLITSMLTDWVTDMEADPEGGHEDVPLAQSIVLKLSGVVI